MRINRNSSHTRPHAHSYDNAPRERQANKKMPQQYTHHTGHKPSRDSSDIASERCWSTSADLTHTLRPDSLAMHSGSVDDSLTTRFSSTTSSRAAQATVIAALLLLATSPASAQWGGYNPQTLPSWARRTGERGGGNQRTAREVAESMAEHVLAEKIAGKAGTMASVLLHTSSVNEGEEEWVEQQIEHDLLEIEQQQQTRPNPMDSPTRVCRQNCQAQ